MPGTDACYMYVPSPPPPFAKVTTENILRSQLHVFTQKHIQIHRSVLLFILSINQAPFLHHQLILFLLLNVSNLSSKSVNIFLGRSNSSMFSCLTICDKYCRHRSFRGYNGIVMLYTFL